MASEQKALYIKEGTATGADVALETAHVTKYDHWAFYNSHASQTLTVKINGQAMTVKAAQTINLDYTVSPENITVKELNTTYRVIGTGN